MAEDTIQKKLNKFLQDYEFEAMLREKRHKELIKAMGSLLNTIKEPEVQVEYKELDTTGIEAAIASIQTGDPEIPKSIQALGEVLQKQIEKNKHEPIKDWKFTLDRLNGDPKGPIQGGRITAVE